MSYAEAIKAPMRQMTTRGSITPAGGVAIPLTGEHIVEWSLEEGGEFPLGSSVSSRLTLRLANTGGEWSSGGSLRGSAVLIGGTVALEVGVMDEGAYIYENIGTFAIESVKYNEGDTSISITGSDALMGLTDIFTDYGVYPLTLSTMLTNMVTQSGLTLDPSFNSLPCNGSVSVTKKPDWGENVTYRQVLSYICAAGGAFVRTGRNGLLQIVPAYNPTPVYEIDTSMYMTLTDDENAFNFNRVKIDYGENESYSATVNGGVAESPTNTITISENPIFFKYKTTSYTKATGTYNPEGTYYLRKNGLYQKAQTPEEATFNAGDYYKRTVSSEDATSAQAIATGLKAFLTGMTFRGMNIRWRGDPLLKIGDRVELTNRAGDSISTSVHHQTLTYKNGLSADISCEIDTVAINAVYTGGGSPIIAIDGAALPGTDADTLDGHDSTYFATAEHAHDAEYLGLTAKAADADKLGGIDADDYSTTQQTNDSIKLAVSGGTNLVPDSGNLLVWLPLYGVTGTATMNALSESPTGYAWHLSSITRTTGNYVFYVAQKAAPIVGTKIEPYTLSFYIRANSAQTLSVSLNNGTILNLSETAITAAYKRVAITWVPTDLMGVAGNYNTHILLDGAGLTDVYVYGLQIEKGTQATDWSPAPEDPASSVQVDAIYPVGAIYMSDVSTSPSTLFGGTWSAISNPPTGASYWWKRTA